MRGCARLASRLMQAVIVARWQWRTCLLVFPVPVQGATRRLGCVQGLRLLTFSLLWAAVQRAAAVGSRAMVCLIRLRTWRAGIATSWQVLVGRIRRWSRYACCLRLRKLYWTQSAAVRITLLAIKI